MKKIVVLTGAGVSAESGIPTFRDSGGLWEGHNIEDVATPEGWHRNPELVLEFYNQRRKASSSAIPNLGHELIAKLQDYFEVTVITQNVDNLHEKAGSKRIIHLHGSIFEARSTYDPSLVYPVAGDIKLGDKCEKGSQLRPNIVWFGEMVPAMEPAIRKASSSDIFIVVGTSLLVYPAAGLIDYVSRKIPRFIIDPKMPALAPREKLFLIEEKATIGMKKVFDTLISEYQ